MSSIDLPPLSPTGQLCAAFLGFFTQAIAVVKETTPRHRGGSLWEGSIEGLIAEQTLAQALHLPWTGAKVWVNPPAERQPDIGEGGEVRWVHPNLNEIYFLNFDAARDKDDRTYHLVSGFAPFFKWHGSILGAKARNEDWKHKYPERLVYRVPADKLDPPELP